MLPYLHRCTHWRLPSTILCIQGETVAEGHSRVFSFLRLDINSQSAVLSVRHQDNPSDLSCCTAVTAD